MRLWRTVSSLGATALLLTAAHSAPDPSANVAGIVCDGPCRLFAIVVGVDFRGSPLTARYAESDARAIARRLAAPDSAANQAQRDSITATRLARAQQALRDTSSDWLQIALLTGAEATTANLALAFERVSKKARANDGFVFYFSGVSASLPQTDSTLPTEHFAVLPGVTSLSDSAMLRRHGLSIYELQQWLDNVRAGDQLVMIEAGSSEDFREEFIASSLAASERSAQLSYRDRVIISPRGYGFESPRIQAGYLAYAVNAMRLPVTDLMRPSWRGRAEAQLYSATDSLAEREGVPIKGSYLEITHEREYLNFMRRILARARGTSRGVGAPTPAAVSNPAVAGGRNYALVIGTDSYEAAEWQRLANPVSDARAVATELKDSFGFETTLLVNPTTDSILDALRELSERPGPDTTRDQVLIFVAGHGYYDERVNMGHLVTRDSKPRATDRYLRTYLSHNQLAAFAAAIPSKHTLVVLDACFGGAFADPIGTAAARGDNESPNAELATLVNEKMKHRARYYLASGGKEYVPDGRPGRHSPFASRFLAALREHAQSRKLLTMSGLRSRIEGLVPDPRSGEFEDSEPGGDFLFIPRGLLR